jgi:hypothetical protein
MIQLFLAIGTGQSEAVCNIVAENYFPSQLEADLQNTLDSFMRAANYGMFSGVNHKPEQSSFQLVASSNDSSKFHFERSYEVRSIDMGAYRVLFDMLNNLALNIELSILVRGFSSSSTVVTAPTSVLNLLYPGTSANACFSVVDNLMEPTAQEVIVRVDFIDELTEDAALPVFELFESWKDIVKRGAYPAISEKEEVDVLCYTEYYFVSPHLLEFAVYGYPGPVEAYFALLNGLCRIHRIFRPILEVELE